MAELNLAGKQVIALGERDGIAGPSIAKVVTASGGTPILILTECFV